MTTTALFRNAITMGFILLIDTVEMLQLNGVIMQLENSF